MTFNLFLSGLYIIAFMLIIIIAICMGVVIILKLGQIADNIDIRKKMSQSDLELKNVECELARRRLENGKS